MAEDLGRAAPDRGAVSLPITCDCRRTARDRDDLPSDGEGEVAVLRRRAQTRVVKRRRDAVSKRVAFDLHASVSTSQWDVSPAGDCAT